MAFSQISHLLSFCHSIIDSIKIYRNYSFFSYINEKSLKKKNTRKMMKIWSLLLCEFLKLLSAIFWSKRFFKDHLICCIEARDNLRYCLSDELESRTNDVRKWRRHENSEWFFRITRKRRNISGTYDAQAKCSKR